MYSIFFIRRDTKNSMDVYNIKAFESVFQNIYVGIYLFIFLNKNGF